MYYWSAEYKVIFILEVSNTKQELSNVIQLELAEMIPDYVWGEETWDIQIFPVEKPSELPKL